MSLARRYVDIDMSSASTPIAQASGIVMTKSHHDKVKHYQKSGEELPVRISRYLRSKHPYKTAESVAARTGISVNTVNSWLKGLSVPGGAAIGDLYYAYGLEFIVAAYPGLACIEKIIRLMERDALAEKLAEADRNLADNFEMLRGPR